MTDKNITCCFTGHRKLPVNKIPMIEEYVRNEITQLALSGVTTFLTGCAIGFDLLTGYEVLALKDKIPCVKLIAVLPCKPEQQTKFWTEQQREMYNMLLEKADETVHVSQNYFSGCMQKRNRWLVENSSHCICYLEKDNGGTAMTVGLARQNGLGITNIANQIMDIY